MQGKLYRRGRGEGAAKRLNDKKEVTQVIWTHLDTVYEYDWDETQREGGPAGGWQAGGPSPSEKAGGTKNQDLADAREEDREQDGSQNIEELLYAESARRAMGGHGNLETEESQHHVPSCTTKRQRVCNEDPTSPSGAFESQELQGKHADLVVEFQEKNKQIEVSTSHTASSCLLMNDGS
jgi:hypothetical protein